MGPSLRLRPVRRVITVLVIFALALALAGCQAQSAGTNSLLAQVQQRGVLRVATCAGNAPFASLDPNGNLVGYEIDISNKLGEALGVKVEFTQTDAPGRVTLLQTGKTDISICTFTRNW